MRESIGVHGNPQQVLQKINRVWDKGLRDLANN